MNWVVFLQDVSSQRTFVGTLQAGVHRSTSVATIAYTILPPFQGQGLGTEATLAMVEQLQNHYGVQTIKAWIDTRNASSIRLVEKLGMQQVDFIKKADHFKGQDSDEFVYQMEC